MRGGCFRSVGTFLGSDRSESVWKQRASSGCCCSVNFSLASQVRAGEWEKGPCWLPCPGWAQSSALGQMGWFPGVLILTSPKPQASLPGPLPLPYLLDAVQNGIRQPSLRFTFSLTLCAARVAQQILKPEEHVYIRVKRFLLSHRYLDLRKVLGFLQLFYSFDFESASGSSDFLGKGCVTNIAVSSMSTRGFSGSFLPFSAVLCVTRAPRVVFWRYDRVLPVSPLELPMSR
ncbi:uncharacterized protein LOC128795441 [Vidua chalybeata]|uniref:uncharacterized protein LOC128795441 n=1 Tax=Vidua chalybeata TaxID=81927 RepID=UPI0023A91318|nr:uncharacterized protein LOC128795441 [Vidua chalybeata]